MRNRKQDDRPRTDRPTWADYFIDLAESVAERSPDPRTQHGCVIVGPDNRIVSTGYNGPPAGMDHYNVPWGGSGKYDWIVHAEENALLWARQSVSGCTAYLTGHPCKHCMLLLAAAGVHRIVYGGRGSASVGAEPRAVSNRIATYCGVRLAAAEGGAS